jgi:hypothetical protein
MWIFVEREKLNYASILGREACLGFSVGQCPMFQKYWRWANQCGSFSKRKGKTPGVHPPLLINSSTNKYPPFHVPDRMNIQDKTKYSPIG